MQFRNKLYFLESWILKLIRNYLRLVEKEFSESAAGVCCDVFAGKSSLGVVRGQSSIFQRGQLVLDCVFVVP